MKSTLQAGGGVFQGLSGSTGLLLREREVAGLLHNQWMLPVLVVRPGS